MVKKRKIEVEMGKIKVITRNDENPIMVIYEVSTCVAIMLYGRYDGIDFVLMVHIDPPTKDFSSSVFYRVLSYTCRIQDAVIDDYDPCEHEDIPLHLHKVIIMGGEKNKPAKAVSYL